MSLLTNALTVGGQDEFTLGELKDTVLAYAKGEVPEVVTVLSKEDMEKYEKASPIEKVQSNPFNADVRINPLTPGTFGQNCIFFFTFW